MDKRVKNTTKALKQTLFDMLEQMPLSKITVTSLCKQAGVNRVTFYHHFADVYDMISQIEISYVEELKDYNFKFTQNGKVNFLWIVRFVKKYSDFYRVVFYFVQRFFRNLANRVAFDGKIEINWRKWSLNCNSFLILNGLALPKTFDAYI